ncbi:hypothetical protein MRX96_058601 [Rhipicephalus microplus]
MVLRCNAGHSCYSGSTAGGPNTSRDEHCSPVWRSCRRARFGWTTEPRLCFINLLLTRAGAGTWPIGCRGSRSTPYTAAFQDRAAATMLFTFSSRLTRSTKSFAARWR